MPRLLPRLRVHLKEYGSSRLKDCAQDKYPDTARPSHFAAGYTPPTVSFQSGSSSILLENVNYVTGKRSNVLRHRKQHPPSALVIGTRQGTRDANDEERQWLSSPWLRMLNSPLRKCFLTSSYLPSDFLIRVAPLLHKEDNNIMASTSTVYVLPDGVLHPHYHHRASGTGWYFVCRRDAISVMGESFAERLRVRSKAKVHPLLVDQIGWELRERVIEEARLLIERIRCLPRASLIKSRLGHVVRRLTVSEWDSLRRNTKDNVDLTDVVAILDLHYSSQLEGEKLGSLVSVSEKDNMHQKSFLQPNESVLPEEKIPLYNVAGLFAEDGQRERLLTVIEELISVQRERGVGKWSSREERSAQREEKESKGFLMVSNKESVRGADSAPLAIALWRLCMWEGSGDGIGDGSAIRWRV